MIMWTNVYVVCIERRCIEINNVTVEMHDEFKPEMMIIKLLATRAIARDSESVFAALYVS